MTLKNRFWNWTHGVKRIRSKECRNVGVYILTGKHNKGNVAYVKYDWNKPFKLIY